MQMSLFRIRCTGAHLCVLFTLSLFFYSLLKPPTPPFLGIKEKCYSSFNDGIYMSSDKKVDLFCLSCVFFLVAVLFAFVGVANTQSPTHQNPIFVSICKRSLPILQGSLISILPPLLPHQLPTIHNTYRWWKERENSKSTQVFSKEK